MVLIERERDGQTGLLKGLSDNYLRVLLPGPDQFMNRTRKVQIIAIDEHGALGRDESNIREFDK